jgi:hypothetical protein
MPIASVGIPIRRFVAESRCFYVTLCITPSSRAVEKYPHRYASIQASLMSAISKHIWIVLHSELTMARAETEVA